MATVKTTLLIEPFYGGSHKQMVDLFVGEFKNVDFYGLPPKKWHWRARASAVYFARAVPTQHEYTKLFCTSVLNLTELIGLRPDLAQLQKIVYFHENQLTYPVRRREDGDIQYGYMQILSCFTADRVVFNSEYNFQSFLSKTDSFLKIVPSDQRPRNLSQEIRPKCSVLYFPMVFPEINKSESTDDNCLHIIWNHRWEHDKNPELFFETLFRLKADGFTFRLSVFGESAEEKPEIFQEAQQRLETEIFNWGFAENKLKYFDVLCTGHVVVSTAKQECFGISVLEATYSGCLPLCPKDQAYPELYPVDCLYSTEAQLYKKLRNFCKHPNLAKQKRAKLNVDFRVYEWKTLKSRYAEFLA